MLKLTFIAASLSLLAANHLALAQSASIQPAASQQRGMQTTTRDSTAEMTELQRAAQRLRESIQAMAQIAPGPQREQAIHAAHEALFDANQAMLRLPVEYRGSAFTWSPSQNTQARAPAGQSPEQALSELRKASDRLYGAVHAMARAPAGTERAQAIKNANDALVETHMAMAWVYDRQLAGSSAADASQPARSGGAASRTGSATGNASSTAGGSVAGGSRSASNVSAVAGGVGINARAKLSDQALPEHNVKLVFALDTGNYVADVKVSVKGESGRAVIDGVANGPWLYAQLPPGSYTADATFNGQTASQRFTVPQRGQRTAIFRWPASAVQAAAGVTPILGTGPQNQPPATAR